ncbi:MAG: hypothetical protein A2W91_05525 [Bacteroidetes bacterium GWF2_38_335]|nr:MAG: hypothetical protein A2W91_05525 [Bacteroidetes bacterium GWF2_38_335]HBS88096.1 hypothetical protein [Bacteroidales bacterium]
MKELTNEEIILSGLAGNVETGLESKKKDAQVSKLGASMFRKQMIERIPQLPATMQKNLKDDRAQISDKEYFVIRELTGTSTDVIKKNEKSEAGLRNIDDAELGENQFFLLSAICLQYRSGNTGRFDELFPDFLANAVFTFKLGTREIMSKNPVDMFQSPVFGYNNHKDFGIIVLNNPKLLIPKKTIAFDIEDAPASMSGYVKLKLIGTEVKSY